MRKRREVRPREFRSKQAAIVRAKNIRDAHYQATRRQQGSSTTRESQRALLGKHQLRVDTVDRGMDGTPFESYFLSL